MTRSHQVAIVSDVHYASAVEQARGNDYESRHVKSALVRLFMRAYRDYIWLRHPLDQNHLLDAFVERAGSPDYVVANGDYSCDTAFVGVSDDGARQSAQECLQKLRRKFAPNFQATIGDHELGKMSTFGGLGGMRLASWHEARQELGLQPFWKIELGNHVLMGVASSLVAFPAFEPDALPAERPEWNALREQHLAEIRAAFAALKPHQRALLFCHDPTALPFLWRDDAVRAKILQIELTVIGHLHSRLIFWKSGLLAGMPPIGFLGHTVKRFSRALSEGRHWRPFQVKLCPSLAGIELLKDGGYCTIELDEAARQPVRFQFHPLARNRVS
jgi:hypothetical protein